MLRLFTCSLCLILILLQGCSVNPVTGKREIMIISEQQEMSLGQEQYQPAQQSQGGLYYLDPELTFYVRQVGEKLAKVSDRPDLPYEFVVLNNSVPNAWALPSGKIAINRGLLAKLDDEAQLAAVLGHEIVHAAARHSAKRMQSNLLISAGVAGLGLALDNQDYRDILVGGAAMAVAKYGRDHELESDHYGMQYMAAAGYDTQAAVELQQLFMKLSEGQSQNWLEGLFASHPPSPERVEENRRTALTLPQSNYRGEDAFMRATARLRKTVPAYDAYDKGVKALKAGDDDKALQLANQAIKLESEEAMFYSLRGDIYKKQNKESAALKEYDKAVSLNPEYFAHPLKRGLTYKELGDSAKAAQDLRRANDLLPTSVANLALGDIEAQSNNSAAAISHYSAAAEASGAYGQEARQKLSRLDLPKNPERYLQIQTLKDKQGRAFITYSNQSALEVNNIVVEVALINASGWVMKQNTLTLGAAGPGQQAKPVFCAIATEAAQRKDLSLLTRLQSYRLR
ncbi:putative Zn-dependent protease [Hahella chejuensis KCTC 2396]|uniref:Putative Zn-dependent protease n=1 Tax=Hahella chejuensis (strain KCTC 2396) TaxID=349521 RepID=Q2SCI7_HAHCH|nr:putative Zn-dependent protease [Hahella chejuensis KCTC 2396]